MNRLAAATVLAALPAALAAQQPTFRSQVDLVQIDTIVTDQAGNPVAGLTADDFLLREDGRARPIATFASVDIPIVRPERALITPTAIEPDVASNEAGEGRLYLITFDDIGAQQALRARRFLRQFIETQVAGNDLVGIAYLGKGAGNSQDFTANKRLLLAQLDKFSGAFPDDAVRQQDRMAAFRDIATFLATIQGRRKAMLLISSGSTMFDAYDVIDYQGGVTSVAADYAREAMVAAARGNVAIYPIDPSGLPAGGGGEGEEAPTGSSPLAANANLRALADMTGGFAFVSQNDFAAGLSRIVRENSSYYILGFYSDDKRDGRFRRVEVSVIRPGLQVRSRSGYMAPAKRSTAASSTPASSRLTAEVAAALSSPIPRADVGMKLFAAPFKGKGKDAIVSVVVQVDPAALKLVERGGVHAGQLELAISATSGRKRYPGVFHVAQLALKPETYAAARRDGLRLVSDLPLPSGTYQVRAAAGNQVDRAGSVVADVVVPNFSKGPLELSGVSLGSARLAAALTVRAGDALAPLPTPPPTTSREFERGDTIGVFAEVYDNLETSSTHTVSITATLRAEDGTMVRSASEERSSAELGRRSGGFGFTAALPLADVAPGLYIVRVEARANTAKRPAVGRDIQIRVR